MKANPPDTLYKRGDIQKPLEEEAPQPPSEKGESAIALFIHFFRSPASSLLPPFFI